MPRFRLGVALLLSHPISCEVNGLRRALGDGALERIAPHITLVPPVNVREDQMANALRVLRKAATGLQPFSVQLGPVSSFHPDTPTLKLGVGGPGLESVKRLRDAVFVPPLERALTWPFVPHVTVADEPDAERIGPAIEALRSYRLNAWFDRMHLLREERIDGQAAWVPIADFPLGPAVVTGRGGLELELLVTKIMDPESAFALSPAKVGTTDISGIDWSRAVPAGEAVAVTARRSDAVVGVLSARADGSVLVVDRVVVVAGHTRQGVGADLIGALGAEGRRRGSKALHLGESASDPELSPFFARMGFSGGVLAL